MTVINIGEVIKNVTDDFRKSHPGVPWRAVAGMRDIAAHKYQTLRMEIVYAYFENSKIVCYDAKPLLRKAVFSALREFAFLKNHVQL